MKKRLLSLFMAFTMMAALFPTAAFAAEDVTVISTADELVALSGQTLTGNYQLGADIDMTGVNMSPINKFSDGTFDGAGHTISNLSMKVTWGNGGLFGQLGSSAKVKDLILSNATISSTVGSSSYGTGGLVGQVYGSATIEGCGISGTVSCKPASSYYASYVGGLVGYLNDECTISNCYSQATVVNEATANSSVTGGFLGKTSSSYPLSVTNCYAAGDVTAAVNYAGGFTGYVHCSSSRPHNYENCYAAGDVTVKSSSRNPCGFAYSYVTSGFTFTNCFYDSEKNTTGFNQSGDAIPVGKTAEELKALADTLGSAFQADRAASDSLNDGYPILGWQYVDPTAEHTVTFTVTPAEATLTWNGKEQTLVEGQCTITGVTAGSYNYQVACEAEDYRTETGTVTVRSSDVTKAVSLTLNPHTLTFTLEPSDAELTVKRGEEPLTPDSGNDYTVTNGTYHYTATKFGYKDATGDVTVDKADATKDVTLEPQPAVTVTFAYGELPAGGDAVTNASLVVKTGERVMEAAGMSFTLPVGYSYSYTFKSANYAKVTGEIDLTGVTEAGTRNITIPLTVKTAWGGADDILQPSGSGTAEDPYQISTGAELAWLAQETNARKDTGATHNAVLTKDIDLGDEPWTPIGNAYATRFASVFDGKGYTVRGLNIQGSYSGNYGLFGYVEDGTVKNLTVEGTVNITCGASSGGSNGIAGIVGQLSGTSGGVENCVNKATVHGGQNVGGVVGYTSSGYNTATKFIRNCANLGDVSSDGVRAGGISGYLYGQVEVENCYNRGTVTGGSWNCGGLIGYMSSSYATVKNCYTSGAISGNNTNPALGGKGSGSWENTSIFFLNTLGEDPNATPKTESEMKSPDFVTALGSPFLPDTGSINGGYPILEFQVTKYDVTFTLSPADAVVEIAGATGAQDGNTWTFQLPDGTYDYTVSKFGYGEVTGQITVSGADVTQAVALTESDKKTVGFQIRYSDTAAGVTPAIEVIWNGQPVPATTIPTVYELPDGDYTYTVKAKGYAKAGGAFTVDETTPANTTISVVLTASTAWDGESVETPTGAGTAASPYQISTGEELAWLANYVNTLDWTKATEAWAELTADIDLGNNPWTPIGDDSHRYKSTFDGHGHTIEGINVSNVEYGGLFGYIDTATIQNVVVKGSISAANSAGGIFGRSGGNAKILNCGNEASVTGGNNHAGGIGGWAGYSSYSDTIEKCYNTGTIQSSYRAGGIVGYDQAESPISNCYNAGAISAQYAGGIAGYSGGWNGPITHCYNTGAATGSSSQGAITPGNTSNATDCYYLEGTASDQNATVKTALEMKQSAFLTLLNGSGSAWKQDPFTNNGFPILSWQPAAAPAESDDPTVAEADFLLLTEKVLLEGQDATMKVTPYLTWAPIRDHGGTYTLTLWKEWLTPTADGNYQQAHAKALTLTNITGKPVSGLTVAQVAEDSGVKVYGENVAFSIGCWGSSVIQPGTGSTDNPAAYLPEGRVCYNLKETLDELGEGRYYVTVTADGAPTPSEKFVWGVDDPKDKDYLAPIYAGDIQTVPYNRMSPVTNPRWEGTKACWDPKPYFDGDEDGYALTVYQKNTDGAWVEGRTLDIPGNYSKLDCVSYFTVGGVYKFTVTALDDAAFGYSESPVSEFSPEYTVTQAEEDFGPDWAAITSAEEWMELANTQDGLADPSDPTSSYQGAAWGKKYYLANDIDFSNLSAAWETKTKSIGTINYPFMGVLDGRGHKITGLTLSNRDSGLFWYVGATGLIRNLTIEGANILVSDNASVLAHNNKGTIRNCAVVNSNITADTGAVVGGMVSRNYGVIEDSYVEGGLLLSNSTTATGHGGFAGSNERGGRISRCWTSMEVKTQSDYAGGFVGLGYGETDNPAYITDCFALGNVTARSYSGGFVGRSAFEDNHYINCYAAGTVTLSGDADPGHEYYNEELHGFIGGNQPHSGFQYDQSHGIENCWFNAAVESEANYGAQPKTLADMTTDDFKATLNAGTEEIWIRADDQNGGLPYLKAVKAPEKAETTAITVTVGLASYDKTAYAFSQMGEAIQVTLDSSGNTRVVDVMDAAQAQGKLTYSYDTTPTFGRYIHTINGRAVESPDGWMFTVNDALSNVSASLAAVKDGDKILWYEGTTENHFQGPTWEELKNSALEWVEISTREQLMTLAGSADPAVLAKNYRLTADLDLTGVTFPGIGSADHPFTGRFDGQDHTVSNVTVTGTENVGFFNVMKGATVKDLNLTNVRVTGTKKVGGLVGWAQAELNVQDMRQSTACLVGGCTVSGAVSGRDTVGGLVGLNDGKTDSQTKFSIACAVDQCTANVAVTGTQDGAEADRAKLGGLAGDNAGVVTKSAALGAVTAAGSNMVGGLLGSNAGDVYDSHADGKVTGGSTVGGFVGLSTGTVKNSYSLGDVNGGGTAVGGFAGSIGTVDTAMSAGTVTGSSAHGFAGELHGQIVGTAAQITAKNLYGSCVGEPALTPVGNSSDFMASTTAQEILTQMTLTTKTAVADQLYKMFGVQLPVDDDLQAETAKYADSVLVASDTGVNTVLSLLNAGQTADAGITVSYEVTDGHLTGGASLTLTQANTGAAKTVEVTVKLTKGNQVCYKKVSVVLRGTLEPAQLMDSIAATLTASSDDWTVMDMVRYAQLPDKTAKTTDDARQNALNLLIAEAAKNDAAASDRARLEIVLRAMGVDSAKLYPINSATAVSNARKLSQMDLAGAGHYAAPYLLLADLQGNLKLTSAQQSSLIQVLKDSVKGGLFPTERGGVTDPDPDTAGAALAALARFYPDNADAKAVVDEILAALPGGMDASGSFGSANSDAMVIIGLIALGSDPAELKTAAGVSVVDGLLSYANSAQNGFTFGGQDNALATEQGFRALVALALFDGSTPCNIYDFSTAAVEPGRATGTGQPQKPVDPPADGADLTVTVTIRTDTADWLTTKTVTVKEGATVYHAFVKALEGTDLTQVGAENGYVKSISKGDVTLAEFDKGKNSGWLYQVNGTAPSVPLTSCVLHDGDAILWYYTADWTKNPSAGTVSGGSAPAAVSIPKVEVTADENGQVTAEITLPKGVEQAVVKVPVKDAAAGNVAVLIHPDGAQTLLKKSVVEGDTVAVLVDRSCTVKILNNSKTFVDTAGHWAAESIDFVASHELFSGVGDSRFVPDAPMDRAMLAAVLYRLEDAAAAGESPFADVAEGTWYAEAVTWASAEGIVNGYGNGIFGPTDPITREQLAAMLHRYARYIGLDTTPRGDLTRFGDESGISQWAKEDMAWAVGAGLINGRPGGLLAPTDRITRAETAAMMRRLVELIVR